MIMSLNSTVHKPILVIEFSWVWAYMEEEHLAESLNVWVEMIHLAWMSELMSPWDVLVSISVVILQLLTPISPSLHAAAAAISIDWPDSVALTHWSISAQVSTHIVGVVYVSIYPILFKYIIMSSSLKSGIS